MKQFFLAMSMAICTVFAYAQTPDGYAYSEDNCASGGPIYYFGNDGSAIIAVCADDCPSVQTGTWSYSGGKITIRLQYHYYGQGENLVMAAASNVYESYSAKKERIQGTEYLDWDGVNGDYGCGSVFKHSIDCSDVHAFLKHEYNAEYPFVSRRLVSEAELAAYSKEELRIMRNEIFAAYGYEFKTKEMQRHFGANSTYVGKMKDVNAFLSDIELKNIETIKKVENKR